MKICPFVSHMLGDDNSNSWTIEGGSIKKTESSDKPTENVVILGYEDDSSQTDTMTEVATQTDAGVPSHLHCLKEACRFYQDKTKSCQFDMIFTMLNDSKDRSPQDDANIAEHVSKVLAKDIDKIWQFQTKSVGELIKSYGETEKKQTTSLSGLKKDLEKSISAMASKTDKTGINDIKKNINALKKKIEEREQSVEDLSSTMSELVLNMHESITKLEKRSEDSLKKMDKLSESIPKEFDLREMIDKSVPDEDALQKMIEKSVPGESDVRKWIEKAMPHEDDFRRWVEESSPREDTFRQWIEQAAPHQDDLKKWVTDAAPREGDVRRWIEESMDARLGKLEPADLSEPLDAIRRRVEELADQCDSDTPKYEEKLDQALTAHNEFESKSESWRKELDKRIQSIQDQQRSWEDQLNRLAVYNEEILERLGEYSKTGKKDRGRSGQKEAKKYNNLGVTSFHNGAYEMARDQFLQAVQLDGEFAEAFNNLGLAYTELDEEDKASEAFTRAIELNPELHAAYNNLGYIHFKKGDYDQAIEMYNEALGKSTHNSSAYTNLGNAYYKLGRTDDAKEAWGKALEIDPGNEKAKRNLDRIGEDAE